MESMSARSAWATLLAVLGLWLAVSHFDYEDTREFECASIELQWDKAQDKCLKPTTSPLPTTNP